MTTLSSLLADGVRTAGEWSSYSSGLREGNRFFVNDDGYFAELVAECKSCEVVWTEPRDLYRARIHPVESESASSPLSPQQLGAPDPSRATAGRLNPDGIPYFYGCYDVATAIAESRPWKGARVSVGKFQSVGRVRIVDLSTIPHDERALARARWAGFMMQRPVHREDRLAYVGTQYLAERLKADGIGGVVYSSSLVSGGTNVALFDPVTARFASATLHEVAAVSYESSLLWPPQPGMLETLKKMFGAG